MAARSGLRDPSWHQPFPTVTGSGETLRTVWTVLWTKTCSADGVDNVDASVDTAKVRVAGSNPVVRSEKDQVTGTQKGLSPSRRSADSTNH